jgi:hypothetical protein
MKNRSTTDVVNRDAIDQVRLVSGLTGTHCAGEKAQGVGRYADDMGGSRNSAPTPIEVVEGQKPSSRAIRRFYFYEL